MREFGLDAVIASRPANVLLLTGYLPIVGTSVAIATHDQAVLLFAPEDERELAQAGSADEVTLFQSATMDRIMTAADGIREPLRNAIGAHQLRRARIGSDSGEGYAPESYASMHLYGAALFDCGAENLVPAAEFFRRSKATLTAKEIDRVRRACDVASLAFTRGRERLCPGMLETEAAAEFRRPLFTDGVGFEGAARADGYVFCMSGPDAAEAFGAYARSRSRRIERDELVLTHCNSHVDGYWTDITRTYSMGEPDERQRGMYDAVFAARSAAIAEVRPGVEACRVDRAARDVMRSRGFGDNFKHPCGHGVGFAAIDHNAIPRLHPKSDDCLESGMVCNVEPGIYIDGFGGLRHCDMVLVTPNGAELLTPFHGGPDEQWIPSAGSKHN